MWAFNPPSYVREAITDHEVSYTQFNDRMDAEAHSHQVVLLYQDAKRKEKRQTSLPVGSVMSLVAAYKRTNAWATLSDNTKRTYNQLLTGVFKVRLGKSTKTIGEINAKTITPMMAEAIYEHLKAGVSEHRANHTVKVLRRVWQVCKRKQLVRSNPFREMGLRSLPDRLVLWEPEEVQALIEHADATGYWSIGTLVLLCYDLCQRPGDIRQLTWDSFSGDEFDFIQEKTKVRVTIPA